MPTREKCSVCDGTGQVTQRMRCPVTRRAQTDRCILDTGCSRDYCRSLGGYTTPMAEGPRRFTVAEAEYLAALKAYLALWKLLDETNADGKTAVWLQTMQPDSVWDALRARGLDHEDKP